MTPVQAWHSTCRLELNPVCSFCRSCSTARIGEELAGPRFSFVEQKNCLPGIITISIRENRLCDNCPNERVGTRNHVRDMYGFGEKAKR